MKILVVEDDFFSRVLLTEMLSLHGTVHGAANGEEAIAAVMDGLLKKQPYDLICLDIVLPDMDGLTILQQIRKMERMGDFELEQAARVVMTSALNDGQKVMTAFREQCDGYLVKPFNQKQLDELLHDFSD